MNELTQHDDALTAPTRGPTRGPAGGPTGRPIGGPAAPAGVDWRRKMSDHIAFALLVYTALQIFVTVALVREAKGSFLPYLALIVLVAAIIPACRMFEKRWGALSDEEVRGGSAEATFRRDKLLIWTIAVALPLSMAALFKGAALVFG